MDDSKLYHWSLNLLKLNYSPKQIRVYLRQQGYHPQTVNRAVLDALETHSPEQPPNKQSNYGLVVTLMVIVFFFGIGYILLTTTECGNNVLEKGENWKNCCVDAGCPNGLNCNNNYCEEPQCDYCQFFNKGKCEDYSCCEDKHCKIKQKCEHNQCIDLVCGECSYIFDHLCKKYTCCTDLDCTDGLNSTNDVCYNASSKKSNCMHIITEPIELTKSNVVIKRNSAFSIRFLEKIYVFEPFSFKKSSLVLLTKPDSRSISLHKKAGERWDLDKDGKNDIEFVLSDLKSDSAKIDIFPVRTVTNNTDINPFLSDELPRIEIESTMRTELLSFIDSAKSCEYVSFNLSYTMRKAGIVYSIVDEFYMVSGVEEVSASGCSFGIKRHLVTGEYSQHTFQLLRDRGYSTGDILHFAQETIEKEEAKKALFLVCEYDSTDTLSQSLKLLHRGSFSGDIQCDKTMSHLDCNRTGDWLKANRCYAQIENAEKLDNRTKLMMEAQEKQIVLSVKDSITLSQNNSEEDYSIALKNVNSEKTCFAISNKINGDLPHSEWFSGKKCLLASPDAVQTSLLSVSLHEDADPGYYIVNVDVCESNIDNCEECDPERCQAPGNTEYSYYSGTSFVLNIEKSKEPDNDEKPDVTLSPSPQVTISTEPPVTKTISESEFNNASSKIEGLVELNSVGSCENYLLNQNFDEKLKPVFKKDALCLNLQNVAFFNFPLEELKNMMFYLSEIDDGLFSTNSLDNILTYVDNNKESMPFDQIGMIIEKESQKNYCLFSDVNKGLCGNAIELFSGQIVTLVINGKITTKQGEKKAVTYDNVKNNFIIRLDLDKDVVLYSVIT